MSFARFWAKAVDRGCAAWGWSDASLAGAQTKAEIAAPRIAAAILDRQGKWRHILWVVFLALNCSGLNAAPQRDTGRDWGVPGAEYIDAETKLRIRELTAGPGAADNLYFHFSNFTADNRYVLFTWKPGAGSTQLFRAEPRTGRVVQLTDDSEINAASACPDPQDPRRVYLLRGAEVRALDVEQFTQRTIGLIPGPGVGGGHSLTLSADGLWLSIGKQRDPANWEIGLMNTRTGNYRTVLTQGFRIGHVQHHPVLPLIFYVWETGGFAPQRTWLVNADGTGNRPFYYRAARTNWFTPQKEWVTHEAWIQDTGEMTMINDKLGIMVVSPEGAARLVCKGDYWHAAAQPDGKRIVADDFEGRLWLVDAITGQTRLLAAELRKTDRIHPHASFDRRGDYVQFHTSRTHTTVALIDLRQIPATAN